MLSLGGVYWDLTLICLVCVCVTLKHTLTRTHRQCIQCFYSPANKISIFLSRSLRIFGWEFSLFIPCMCVCASRVCVDTSGTAQCCREYFSFCVDAQCSLVLLYSFSFGGLPISFSLFVFVVRICVCARFDILSYNVSGPLSSALHGCDYVCVTLFVRQWVRARRRHVRMYELPNAKDRRSSVVMPDCVVHEVCVA